MIISDRHKLRYEAQVKECFGFLENKRQLKFGGVRVVGGNDPRDSGLVARYSCRDLRIDIAWKENEGSLSILIKLDRDDLSRQERYIYFEPFIEFLTNCKTAALVPYLREGMTIGEIQSVMDKRKEVFKVGLDGVIRALGSKMETFFADVESASSDAIRTYHAWMNSKP